jgi:hypothetical protein
MQNLPREQKKDLHTDKTFNGSDTAQARYYLYTCSTVLITYPPTKQSNHKIESECEIKVNQKA